MWQGEASTIRHSQGHSASHEKGSVTLTGFFAGDPAYPDGKGPNVDGRQCSERVPWRRPRPGLQPDGSRSLGKGDIANPAVLQVSTHTGKPDGARSGGCAGNGQAGLQGEPTHQQGRWAAPRMEGLEKTQSFL